MSMPQAYHGIIRKGRIHLTPPAELPEEGEVYVLVTRQTAVPRTAVPGESMPTAAEMTVAREEAAFYRMHTDLWQKYPGEYVAVAKQRRGVDHDADQWLCTCASKRVTQVNLSGLPVRET
ncbi:MAG: hypothetical protein IPH82_26830 [Chloroflexi bacterium]|nr:hypothetical protein [Chloroflexota bacterium]